MSKIKIPKFCTFTKPELDRFYELCNFTDEEAEYLKYKSKDLSNIEIAFKMNVSDAKVSKLARRVKDKIIKVI